VGTTQKYSDNFETAFSGKKSAGKKAAAKTKKPAKAAKKKPAAKGKKPAKKK
jgi:hypothetical protein